MRLHLGDVVRIARNHSAREEAEAEAEAAAARLAAQEAVVDIQKVVGPESTLYMSRCISLISRLSSYLLVHGLFGQLRGETPLLGERLHRRKADTA